MTWDDIVYYNMFMSVHVWNMFIANYDNFIPFVCYWKGWSLLLDGWKPIKWDNNEPWNVMGWIYLLSIQQFRKTFRLVRSCKLWNFKDRQNSWSVINIDEGDTGVTSIFHV